ncbi:MULTISPECIES: LCP family protein [Streptomycetaceae]|uniref:LCP family protein n=1 Tax=Streptomycetaceae TaxID=2062 RepID=UPI000213EC21|nr:MULTISPECIES: LCP family protein [Streptomycetaceae]CCB73036.1 Transcriptional regulator [Streptantibioticus cattleyicolor NRRL 8057 = DSM 46488]
MSESADGSEEDGPERPGPPAPGAKPPPASAPASPAGGDGADDDTAGDPAPVPARRRRVLRAVTVAGCLFTLLVVGIGALVYEDLSGNLRGLPLFGGTTGDAGRERPDAFGRTPVNVLVIGSDTRATADDCAIGGDCGPGENADVEMVVHLAADRAGATVLSVPRDTVTDLPACRDAHAGTVVPAHHGQLNSTLQYGPGCTVAAVHQLTGIPIDHFLMVDFAGVVRLSDVAGGVPVCVSDDVYDPYSHLKLTRGEHVLKGMAVLQFVRSRHAFGDGSDLGRTYAQHLYLAALVRTLKAAGTLSRPATVYSLADAATRALTVDTGLDSLHKLLGLADDIDKVPPSRVTFVTMQSVPDPGDPDRVLVAPAARKLFEAIAADRPLTPAGAARPAAGPAPPPARPAVTPSATVARAGGLPVFRPGVVAPASSAPPVAASSSVPAPASASASPASSASASPDAGSPLADAHPRSADQGGECAQVSRFPTVLLGGVAMTPVQAYAASRGVPLSAP